MRPVRKLSLSTDEVELVDETLVLELSACGRGFITARTEKDYTGKLVRIDVGYPGQFYRWFTGYVERSQPSENGSQRLFVRELVGIFDKMWPCSFQHPTLKTITDWLQERSGLTFIPQSFDKPVPHFTHSGTGFQLLNSLGRAFGLQDYIWYQTPGGEVYVGEASGGMFAGKPVTVPHIFNQASTAGDTLTFPVIPGIRPGVDVNGRRVTQVRLQADTMEITVASPLSKTAFRRQLEAAVPELAGRMHLPRVARIVGHPEATGAGDVADPFRPRYAVDVQLLDENGQPAPGTPVFSSVPLPVPMGGTESGMFSYPPAGTLVEVAFTEGRQDKPVVRQTLAEGNNMPAVKPGEQLQQQRNGVFQRVATDGSWQRETDRAISEKSASRSIATDKEQREAVSREAVIKADDTLKVVGTWTAAAGAVRLMSAADASLAAGGAVMVSATKDISVTAGKDINAKAKQIIDQADTIRQMVAGEKIELIAPSIWMGTSSVNVAQLMIDTLDLVKQLAQQCASHTHPDTGGPTNADAFNGSAQSAGTLKEKYDPLIG